MQIKGRLTAGFLADSFFSKRFICKGLRFRLGSLLAFFEIAFGGAFRSPFVVVWAFGLACCKDELKFQLGSV